MPLPACKKDQWILRQKVYQCRVELKFTLDQTSATLGTDVGTIARIMKGIGKRMDDLDKLYPKQGLRRLSVDKLVALHPHLFGTLLEYKKGKKLQAEREREKWRDEYHLKKNNCTSAEFSAAKKAKAAGKLKIKRNRLAKEKDTKARWSDHKNYYPTINVPKSKCLPGVFDRPDIKPGELKILKINGKDVLEGKAAEIGMPKLLAKKLQDITYTAGFAVPLEDFVGKCADPKNLKRGKEKKKQVNEWTIWKRRGPSWTSDMTYVYPSTEEEYRKTLVELDKGGFGEVLQNVAEFLGHENDKPTVMIEMCYLGVSFKFTGINDTHVDHEEGHNVATLLIPLELPYSTEPEFFFKGSTTKGGPTPEKLKYRYRMDAALIFKDGTWHGSNAIGHILGHRLMLLVQIRQYDTEIPDWEYLIKQSYAMPAAKEDKKTLEGQVHWHDKHCMETIRTSEGNVRIKYPWDRD